eukprot:3006764-Pleurochrysis_carterae.AAC.1
MYSAPASRAAVNIAAVRLTTERVLTAAYDGRPAVLSRVRAKVAGNRESGTRWGGDHSGIIAGGTTLEETLVHRIMEQVVGLSSPVCPVVINGIALHSGLCQESCDAIGAMERAGEEKQNSTRARSSADYVVSGAYVMGRRWLIRRLSESGRHRRRRRLRRNASSADTSSGCWRPREIRFVEVHVGGHDNTQARYVHVESTRRLMVATEVDTDPCARIHACLGDGRLGFYGEGFASKWHYTHDRWLDSCDDFKRCLGPSGRRRCAIQDVDSVLDSIVPKTDRCGCGNEVGTGKFHD